ncbi:MAG: hypothetical protein JNL11_16655 [Bdellovibrionaceae bacterium]|nr:hypothetical protein [Pseudobdellovibrionaceae bacterium]
MSLTFSMFFSARLLGFAMLIQAVEFIYLSRQVRFQTVWSYRNLHADLVRGLPLKANWIAWLFSETLFRTTLIIQIVTASLCLIYPHISFLVILFFTHLFICIRFRGNFNGGSDMMTFVVLTGLFIAFLGQTKLGLIYIAIHTLYSYFKAGIAKARFKEWWTGKALPVFLRRSQFLDIHQFGDWLEKHRSLQKFLGTSTILFEIAAFLLIFFPTFATIYFALALAFHATIYFVFGLNRFFWIWISAWPATLYSVQLLARSY